MLIYKRWLDIFSCVFYAYIFVFCFFDFVETGNGWSFFAAITTPYFAIYTSKKLNEIFSWGER